MSLFWQRRSAPPDLLPAFTDDDLRLGAHAHFERLRLLRPLLLLLGRPSDRQLLSWRPATPSAPRVDQLVLGDSYADDVNMGFCTWPSRLARATAASHLSVARAGDTTRGAGRQLAAAQAFAAARRLSLGPHTLVVLHLGGNDLLARLPLALPRLLLDLHAPTLAPAASFAAAAAAALGAALGALLSRLAAAGLRRVLLALPPLCAALPLARAVARLCGGAEARLAAAAARLRALLARALRGAAARAGVELRLFDEGAALDEMRGAAWKDSRHPAAEAHAELAARAAALVAAPWGEEAEDGETEGADEAEGGVRRRRAGEVELPLL
ncbi:hypothetical protein AB1Y20_023724 [Prymnesium parvum]|uniref:SGNH hydrolase-type esterase domain-containing protein n=1 Tax=Prymnesium parvum TaxID=97485 RepID=A0AB34JHY6_PRYPA